MMRQAELLVMAVAMAIAAPARAETPAGLVGVADTVEAMRVAWGVPGVAVAIVSRDGELGVSGHGVRDIRGADPVDGDTIFLINSMTKSFTGALAAHLQQQGALRLDDRLADHLPSFRVADPVAAMTLTIEDALVHRTGIAETGAFEDIDIPLGELLRRFAHLGLAQPMRTHYSYNNEMFGIAGSALVGGGDWAGAIRREILDPLGMTRTVPDVRAIVRPDQLVLCHECPAGVAPAGEDAIVGWSNVASPHMLADGRIVAGNWRTFPGHSAPATNIAASSRDLGRFLKALLRGYAGLDGTPFSQAAVRDMLTPRIPDNDGTEWLDGGAWAEAARRMRRYWGGTGYALGWSCTIYADERLCHHAGASLGFLGTMVLLPDRGVGFAVLTNYRHTGWGLSDAIAMTLLDRITGRPPVDWSSYVKGQIAKEARDAENERGAWRASLKPFSPPLTPPAALAGRYVSPLLGTIEVAADGRDRLRLVYGARRGPATHVSANIYEMTWISPRGWRQQIAFDIGADGRPQALVIDGRRFPREAP